MQFIDLTVVAGTLGVAVIGFIAWLSAQSVNEASKDCEDIPAKPMGKTI